MQLCELRGNVDTRLRRLLEPRGAERQLDGVVLAFAGLARLWQDESVGAAAVLRELLAGLPRMLLPLTLCPAAPAQGALAIECRADDERTRALLATIDDAPTREAIEAERALLAQRGGGCHQRFGATQVQVDALGALLYVRDAGPDGPAAPELRWTLPPAPRDTGARLGWQRAALPRARGHRRCGTQCAPRLAAARRGLHRASPRSCLKNSAPPRSTAAATSGSRAPKAGLRSLRAASGSRVARNRSVSRRSAPRWRAPLLALPPLHEWLALTHEEGAAGWGDMPVLATYRHVHAGSARRRPRRRIAGLVAQWHTVRTLARGSAGGLPACLRSGQDCRDLATRRRAGADDFSIGAPVAGVAAHMNLKAGQGSLSVMPARRARLIAALAALWIVLVLVLGAGWVALVISQARQISELQSLAGSTDSAVAAQWASTHRRIVGESAVFFLLLLAVSVLLAWLYWRESWRARGMQAFFAAVTHELRTPLTSIRLQAEAIAEGDQRAELARRLLEDSHRLESQIDKTLELARIEGGGPLAEQSVPLHGWLERSLQGIAAAHGVRVDLVVHLDPGLPPILADAARCR